MIHANVRRGRLLVARTRLPGIWPDGGPGVDSTARTITVSGILSNDASRKVGVII